MPDTEPAWPCIERYARSGAVGWVWVILVSPIHLHALTRFEEQTVHGTRPAIAVESVAA